MIINIFDAKEITKSLADYTLEELKGEERRMEIAAEINDKYDIEDLNLAKKILELENKTMYQQQAIIMGMWASILALVAILASVYLERFGVSIPIVAIIIYSGLIYLTYNRINKDIQKIKQAIILISVAERYKNVGTDNN